MSASIESSPEKRSVLPVILNLRRCGLATAALLALVGAFFVIQAAWLPLGSVKLPGPGFFPLALGGALLILSLAVGFGIWSEGHNPETVELAHRDAVVTALLLLLVPAGFEPAGAYLTLGTFGFLMLILIARTRILTAFASAGTAMAATWYFFHKLLGVQLPLGLLAG